MRLLVLLSAVAITGPAFSQSVAGKIGVYGVAGEATQEATLFPERTTPTVSLGLHLGGGVDVRAGVNLETSSRRLVSQPQLGREFDFYDRNTTFQTRAATLSLGLNHSVGPLDIHGRVGAVYDVLDRRIITRLRDADDEALPVAELPTTTETSTGTSVHTAASTTVAIPFQRGAGRMSPGLGAAIGTSNRLRGSLDAPIYQASVFASFPTTVYFESFAITLDASTGVQRTSDTWQSFLNAAVRLDL